MRYRGVIWMFALTIFVLVLSLSLAAQTVDPANHIWLLDGTTTSSPSGGGTTSPAGADTQVQFNDSGSFGGDEDFVWNKTTQVFSIGLVDSDTHLVLPSKNDQVTPSLAFGDGDTGFYESSDDGLVISIAGSHRWEWDGGDFMSTAGTGGALISRGIATGTSPSYSFDDDTNTGLGRAGADQLSGIAGGVEAWRASEVGSVATFELFAPFIRYTIATITASTSQSQGNGALTAEVNEIAVVANLNDTVTMPAAAAGKLVVIQNNGANILQIFPASGDDLGAGVDVSLTTPPSHVEIFLAYNDTNWISQANTTVAHGTMLDEDNTDAYVVNDSGGDFHSYHTNGLALGQSAGWAFDAGGAGTSFPIASVANSVGSPGTQILVTTTGSHLLAAGDIISQTNLADAAYVGIFEVVVTAAATTYEVAAVFTATGTGTMDQAATMECAPGLSDDYHIVWHATATSATNNENFDFAIYKGIVTVPGSKVTRKFGTANDFGSFSGGGVVEVVCGDGEKISLALSNQDTAGNITLKHLTIVATRL